MKVFEVTTTVEIDEGVLDNFKAFGSEVVGLFKDDPKVSSDATSGNTASSNTASSDAGDAEVDDVSTTIKNAKDKIAAQINPDENPDKKPEGKLDFTPTAVGSETLKAFKQWLRADGPGKVKFARAADGGVPGPQEYAAAVKRLYAQGLSLRAIEVLKVWKSASSKIKPESLAKIKAAAAAQAKAIGLN